MNPLCAFVRLLRAVVFFFFVAAWSGSVFADVIEGFWVNQTVATAACSAVYGSTCTMNQGSCNQAGFVPIGFNGGGFMRLFCYPSSGSYCPTGYADDGTGHCLVLTNGDIAGQNAAAAAAARGASAAAQSAASAAAKDTYNRYVASGASASTSNGYAAIAGELAANEYIAAHLNSATAAYDAAMASCNYECDASPAWWSAFTQAGGTLNAEVKFPDGANTRRCSMMVGGSYYCLTTTASGDPVGTLSVGTGSMLPFGPSGTGIAGTAAVAAVVPDSKVVVTPSKPSAVVQKVPPVVTYFDQATGSAVGCTASMGMDGIWHMSGNCPSDSQPSNDFLRAFGTGQGVSAPTNVGGKVGTECVDCDLGGDPFATGKAALDSADAAANALFGEDKKVTALPWSWSFSMPVTSCTPLTFGARNWVMTLDWCPALQRIRDALSFFYYGIMLLYMWRSATSFVGRGV